MTPSEFISSLSVHLFWDVAPASVDVERHKAFLIPRIMDRGTLADVHAAWNYYGEETVREMLLNAATLHKKTLAFFANQFDLPREAFRAFHHPPVHWNP